VRLTATAARATIVAASPRAGVAQATFDPAVYGGHAGSVDHS